MLCPACEKEMLVLEVDDVEIDWCGLCQGIWLDEGELELMAETHGADSPVLKALEKNTKGEALNRRCPVCNQRMRLVELPCDPPVEIDKCPGGHGLWFDKGELEKVVSSLSGEPVADIISSFFPEKN